MLEIGFISPFYGDNTTIGLMTINTLLDPSESLARTPSLTAVEYAMSSYAGNFGGPGMITACNGTIIPVKNNLIFGLMGLLGSTPPVSAGPVRLASITDGTSNTALFSEHLVAIRNGVFAPPDPSVSPGSPNGKRGIFQTSVNVALDQGSVPNALAFVAACKTIPAGTLAVTDDAFGAQWLLSMDYTVASTGYTHVMTPNGISCIGISPFGISDQS